MPASTSHRTMLPQEPAEDPLEDPLFHYDVDRVIQRLRLLHSGVLWHEALSDAHRFDPAHSRARQEGIAVLEDGAQAPSNIRPIVDFGARRAGTKAAR